MHHPFCPCPVRERGRGKLSLHKDSLRRRMLRLEIIHLRSLRIGIEDSIIRHFVESPYGGSW